MSESSGEIAQAAIGKRSNRLPTGAIHCTGTVYARAARGIWPIKTAEHWAAAAGIQVRMARYWLAGSHRVSADGKLALIRELE